MSLPVKIENDAVRMEVWPQFGGKVSSIIDKADRFELLFTYPAELPTGSEYGKPYPNGWYAGWDECFPAVASSAYPGHPYDGVTVPDHGELWGLPTTAVPTKDGITTVWHGLRFGYRLTRKLFLDGASVRAEYTLINLAPFEFKFVWAMHALMALTVPAQIDLPAQRIRLSHDAMGRELGEEFDWPSTGGGLDFSQPLDLPANGGWKLFSVAPISAPVRVRYPSRSRSAKITFESLASNEATITAAYWGIWINTGGWVHHKHFAIEPTTGRFDDLERASRDGSAGRVTAAGRAQWSVRLDLI